LPWRAPFHHGVPHSPCRQAGFPSAVSQLAAVAVAHLSVGDFASGRPRLATIRQQDEPRPTLANGWVKGSSPLTRSHRLQAIGNAAPDLGWRPRAGSTDFFLRFDHRQGIGAVVVTSACACPIALMNARRASRIDSWIESVCEPSNVKSGRSRFPHQRLHGIADVVVIAPRRSSQRTTKTSSARDLSSRRLPPSLSAKHRLVPEMRSSSMTLSRSMSNLAARAC
jgi:hypothetical protein